MDLVHFGCEPFNSYNSYEVQKNKRLRDEEYISISTGVTVFGKSNINGVCSCKHKCPEQLSLDEKGLCLKTLLDGRSTLLIIIFETIVYIHVHFCFENQ